MRETFHVVVAAIAALGLAGPGRHAVAHAAEAGSSSAATAGLCESRTINYITHTLPQQCLRTSWSSANASLPAAAAAEATDRAVSPTLPGGPEATGVNGTLPGQPGEKPSQPGAADEADKKREDEAADIQDLATSSFMSFEEWKAIQLKKAGQDPADLQARRKAEPKGGEAYPAPSNGDLDSLGDDGEINLEFDVLSEKVSEMTASAGSSTDVRETRADDAVLYDDGRTQYYRSKDAGKTCKERFSFSSVDGGATVLKTSQGVKNPKAILVENKDSYMLFECRMDNKFVIVELSDDILVDTVVLANFEFFSSMVRAFRVSVSDRYPVKMEKWKDLGTFEARNSRDIQPFLVEHPQIWARYVRIEFLTYYGNEFYCPVSLLRVHGTRMLDSWKESEGGQDDDDETPEPIGIEEAPPPPQVEAGEAAPSDASVVDEGEVEYVSEVGMSPWRPVFFAEGLNETCWTSSPTTEEPTQVSPAPAAETSSGADAETASATADLPAPASNGSEPVRTSAPPVPSGETASAPPIQAANATSVSPPAPPPSRDAASNSTESAPSPAQPSASPKTPAADPPGSKPVASKAFISKPPPPPPPPPKQGTTTVIPKSSPPPQQAAKNRTASAGQAVASPTVQESFFKTVTKRLQLLESNTSLSLQYIEDQSRFLQDALLKMERKQIARVHSFLDTLNGTVLSELRTVRTQYDQIWQSTVLALETQRDQADREIVALSDRLGLLADEVVFQKRMAILQAALLLSCLALVIFSRATTTAASALVFPPAAPPAAASPASYPGSPGPGSPAPARRRDSVLARSHSYPEKVLPLTPTSDYARSPSPPPPARVLDSRASSYFDVDVDDDESSLRGSVGDGDAFTPPRRRPAKGRARFDEASGGDSPLRRSTSSSDEVMVGRNGEEAGLGEEEADRLPTPLARSSLSLGGSGARKPLPALPEDPS